jgi:CMP-N,N'-diacetyllegionaminic acid synthase
MPSDTCLLAIVPARGGSKRLPRKNMLPLGGKPLIAWTLDAARESGCFCDVLVSTDSAEIAASANLHKALVPWLRPAELSNDTARSIDVALHALDWYEAKRGRVDAIMLLQPTSPFRSIETIRRGAAMFAALGADAPVVSVSPAISHPAWTFSLNGSNLVPFCAESPMQIRSQDLSPAFTLNGAVYISRVSRLRESMSFFSSDMHALVMEDPVESHDIDTAFDWQMAELFAAQLRKS